jgi:toxin ParE1/3/4
VSLYRISSRARRDLETIADYTTDQWGEEQSDHYSEQLAICFQTLAESPNLGRPCDELSAGVKRFEHGSHVVFFQAKKNGIVIGRILHKSMLPTLQRLNPKNDY